MLRSSDCLVAPVGSVNTKTAKLSKADWHDWDQIWDCWEEGEGINLLLTDNGGWLGDKAPKYRIVHTSESNCTSYENGDRLDLVSNRNCRSLGSWTVVATADHDREGLKAMGEIAGKASLPIATFK